MRRNWLTWTGVGIGLLVLVLSKLYDLDPFDRLADFFETVEQYELDEFFIAVLIVLVFFAADLLLKERKRKIEHEKVKVYKAMVSSAHHVLNNFLNQMLLFKITAEDTPGFDKEVLDLYDVVMEEAKEQISALSSITEVSEERIKEAVRPKSGPRA